jgi:hypothetical protein
MEFALDLPFEIGMVEAAKQMHAPLRFRRSRAEASLAIGALLVLGQPARGPTLAAQLPGLPVLQNSFVGPGLAAAANVGGGGGGSAYAAAVGWAPRSARFQFSVGAGAFVADGETGGAFGARVAMPVFSLMNGNLGIAAFGGVGGARGPRVQGARVGLGHAPVGAAIGYRRALGATRAFSVYAAPFFAYHRSDFGTRTRSAGLFRVSIGGDFAITRALGVTAGLELGGTGSGADPGPDGAIWGAGVSYAFGRR